MHPNHSVSARQEIDWKTDQRMMETILSLDSVIQIVQSVMIRINLSTLLMLEPFTTLRQLVVSWGQFQPEWLKLKIPLNQNVKKVINGEPECACIQLVITLC